MLKEGYQYEEVNNRILELAADCMNGLDPARVRGVADHLMGMSDFTARKIGLYLDKMMDLAQELNQVHGTDKPTIWTPNGH